MTQAIQRKPEAPAVATGVAAGRCHVIVAEEPGQSYRDHEGLHLRSQLHQVCSITRNSTTNASAS
jgi:hypothetical protein